MVGRHNPGCGHGCAAGAFWKRRIGRAALVADAAQQFVGKLGDQGTWLVISLELQRGAAGADHQHRALLADHFIVESTARIASAPRRRAESSISFIAWARASWIEDS